MAAGGACPTPYQRVNEALGSLLHGVEEVLGRRFIGMALYGSLATGGFDPRRSDVDVVVVTDHDLPDDLLPALAEMHARVAADATLGSKLEVSYLPTDALRRYDPDAPPRPYWNEGRLRLGRHGSDWVIQRHVLREHGVVVAGPPLRPAIDAVGPDALRRAALGTLREWWLPMLADPARLGDPTYQAYAVLTVCRALQTIEHGTIASKHDAARWARGALDEQWALLISWAAAWPGGPPRDDPDATLAFIRYALDRAQAALVGPPNGRWAEQPDEPSTPVSRGTHDR
jgi:hypothetical protein